jgi:hypothetical protein
VLLHENDQFGWSPEQSQRYVDSLHVSRRTPRPECQRIFFA